MDKEEKKKAMGLALGKTNYIMILIGACIIALGYILMIGGKASSPDVFNEEVFSTMRITVAPIVSLAGFIFVIYAIMKKPRG